MARSHYTTVYVLLEVVLLEQSYEYPNKITTKIMTMMSCYFMSLLLLMQIEEVVKNAFSARRKQKGKHPMLPLNYAPMKHVFHLAHIVLHYTIP